MLKPFRANGGASFLSEENIEISWMVGGPAGAGVMRTGQVFAATLIYMGYYVFGTNEYPSLIRGGHNMYKIYARLGEQVYSQLDLVDLYLALDKLAVERRIYEIRENGILVYDSDEVRRLERKRDDLYYFPVPMRTITRELKVPVVTRNMAGLGASAYILGIPFEYVEKAIRRIIPRYIDENIKVARRGYEYAEEHYEGEKPKPLKIGEYKPKLFIDGNSATAIAAIKAGMKLLAAYPITPQTPLLEYVAQHADDYGVVAIQAEHEIASILIAIGAGYAGVRAMTATSGPGLSLKTESIGLAAMAEIPLVIVNVQRQGPSTGMATHQAQGDLMFSVNIGHSENTIVVLAPGDVEEVFYYIPESFNIAEKYQLPVIVLLDKYLAESHYTLDAIDYLRNVRIERGPILSEKDIEEMKKRGEEYLRYKITDTGVSPRIIPGTRGALFRCEGSEHDEHGYYTEKPERVIAMWRKRFRKLETLLKELREREFPLVKYYGYPPEEANAVLVIWGSVKGPVLEALRILRNEYKLGVLQVVLMKPFPDKEVLDILTRAKQVVDVENNYTSQLARLIREETGYHIEKRINKYDGRPFNPVALSKQLREVIG